MTQTNSVQPHPILFLYGPLYPLFGLFSFMRATCPTHLIFRDLIAVILVVLGEQYNYGAAVYVIFCRFLLLARHDSSLLPLMYIAMYPTADNGQSQTGASGWFNVNLMLNKINYISYIN